jgi:hypothetical protein
MEFIFHKKQENNDIKVKKKIVKYAWNGGSRKLTCFNF